MKLTTSHTIDIPMKDAVCCLYTRDNNMTVTIYLDSGIKVEFGAGEWNKLIDSYRKNET